MFQNTSSSLYSKAADQHTLTMSGRIHVSGSLQVGEFLECPSHCIPKMQLRTLQTMLKSVVYQLLDGWESTLQKTFERESYGGKGQRRRTSLICSSNYGSKQGEDLRILILDEQSPTLYTRLEVIYLASPYVLQNFFAAFTWSILDTPSNPFSFLEKISQRSLVVSIKQICFACYRF